ncbi:hypothetical protein [uncultured Aquimarina sp.]|uniref:hypothetical protein n=1 Tax=uncultured Aquimarina sp. TaxID=575652 RepID=UPI002621A455|nr:hypothetical protein [uncultured Aquimarina sp.]
MKKSIVNFCLIVIGILLLNSCENEELAETVSTSQQLPTNTSIDVDKSEIPNVVGFLQNKTKNGLEIKLAGKSNTSYTGELDLESIKAIIHEQGSETYTFNIKDKNRYQSFSNLHASIRDGKLYTYILTYEFDKSFYDHFDFAKYSGIITLSNLEGEILNVTTLEEGAQVNELAKTHHDCSTVTFRPSNSDDCHRPYEAMCPDVAYDYTHCESILDSTGGLPWNNCMSCNNSNNGPGSNYNNNNGLGGSGNGGDGSLGDNQLSNSIIYDGRFIDNLANVLGRPIGLAESAWIFSSEENYELTQDIRSLISSNKDFLTGIVDPAVLALGNSILDASVANDLTNAQTVSIFRLLIENGNAALSFTFFTELIKAKTSENVLEREIANGIIQSLENNTVFDFSPYISSNAQTISTGPTGTCPSPPCDPTDDFEVIFSYGGELIQGLSDAFYSSILRSYEWWVSNEREGRFVRQVLEYKEIDFHRDIDDETLGEMFIVRYDGNQLVIEWDAGLGVDLVGLGFDILDVATIISPSRGGGAFLAVNGGTRITAAAMKTYLAKLKEIAETTLAGGRGYKSFNKFKAIEGNASSGNALHHIVEQNGYKRLNQQKFGKTNIHNTKNIIDIPNGAGELHRRVTGYYNSITPFTNGKTVREWLSTQSFQEQYDFGIRILRELGWDGITGIID